MSNDLGCIRELLSSQHNQTGPYRLTMDTPINRHKSKDFATRKWRVEWM